MSHGSILVVDDEAGIRQQLAAILGDEGYVVSTADSGEEALAALAREIYDLVLLDVWLPGADGIETLRQVRASGLDVPVVMISGAASSEVAVRAVREGAHDFLDKPLALETGAGDRHQRPRPRTAPPASGGRRRGAARAHRQLPGGDGAAPADCCWPRPASPGS